MHMLLFAGQARKESKKQEDEREKQRANSSNMQKKFRSARSKPTIKIRFHAAVMQGPPVNAMTQHARIKNSQKRQSKQVHHTAKKAY